MASSTPQEKAPSTVSGRYDIETNGTIVTVLDPDVKKSLSARLAKDHPEATLAEYEHEVVVEDYSNGKVTVKVSAESTPKK